MQRAIENELARRGWESYPMQNGGWGEVTFKQFYRKGDDDMVQTIEVSDWSMDAVEVANRAENALKRPESKSYWSTYCPTVI